MEDNKNLGFELEKVEMEIKETYVDEDGKIEERIKKVMVPTGNIIFKGPAQE